FINSPAAAPSTKTQENTKDDASTSSATLNRFMSLRTGDYAGIRKTRKFHLQRGIS
ncbi:hypothetical protein CHARACLAT_023380, partial [Characodon lateralis]|nr:hypothetical protein [Characodon lateralis]